MLNLNNKLYVSLKVDGSEIEYGNLVSVVATEGNGALVPAIKICLTDPLSLMSSSNKALTEGNEIELTVAMTTTDNQVRPRKYRIFSPNRGNQAFNPTVTIVGILDAPGYVTDSVRESYSGTTEDVLKSVAAKCSLKYTGPSSIDGRTMNDSQKWLNICRNRATFVKDVVEHGWIDQYSGMSAALTSYGELKYRDLIALINTQIDKIKFVFMHNALASSSDSDKKTYLVKQARDRSSAGLMASWHNYGSTRTQSMLSGVAETSEELKVRMPGKYLPINKEVADKIDRARIEVAPIDCGNVHNKYEIAKYQNTKLNALFTEKMSLLIDVVTDVQLYDIVVYRQEDADLTQPVKNTDVYIIVGKTIAVSGGAHYAERIELARMSLTMKGSTDLELPSSSASESTMIPDVQISPSSIGSSFASTRGTINSLTSLISGVSSSNALLENAKSAVSSTINSSVSVLKNVLSQATSGIVDSEAISSIAKASSSMLSNLSNLNGIVNYCAAQNSNLLSAVSGLNAATRNLVLAQSNGLTTSLANQYSLTVPCSAITTALSNTLNSITRSTLLSAMDYSPAFSDLQEASVLANSLNASVNNQWNTALAAFRGIPAATTYQTGTPQLTTNILQALSSSNNSDSELLALLHNGLKNDYSTTPNWQEPTSMCPISQSASMVDSVTYADYYATRLSENVA